MTAETPAVEPETCVNGHLKIDYWTVTPKGRKYCKACARAASKASKAKTAKPNPARLTPELGEFLEGLFTASKKGTPELREQAAAFFEAHRA